MLLFISPFYLWLSSIDSWLLSRKRQSCMRLLVLHFPTSQFILKTEEIFLSFFLSLCKIPIVAIIMKRSYFPHSEIQGKFHAWLPRHHFSTCNSRSFSLGISDSIRTTISLSIRHNPHLCSLPVLRTINWAFIWYSLLSFGSHGILDPVQQPCPKRSLFGFEELTSPFWLHLLQTTAVYRGLLFFAKWIECCWYIKVWLLHTWELCSRQQSMQYRGGEYYYLTYGIECWAGLDTQPRNCVLKCE